MVRRDTDENPEVDKTRVPCTILSTMISVFMWVLIVRSGGVSFLGRLTIEARRAVDGPKRPVRRIVRIVVSGAHIYFDACRRWEPDVQARFVLAWCGLVLAAYRALMAETGDSTHALVVTRAAFARVGRAPVRFLTRLSLVLGKDPIRLAARLYLAPGLGRLILGSRMAADREVTSEGVDLIVRRCAFHEFFVESGEPLLTLVFCTWDRNFLDVMDRSGHAIRSERPTTISLGGLECRFRSVRGDASSSTSPRDVVLSPDAASEGRSGK